MDLHLIDNVGIFNVVLGKILDVASIDQEVVGPETELVNIGLDDSESRKNLAIELVDSIPLFTDIMSNSYSSWKTVYDVYQTVVRLDRDGIDNISVNHGHRKKRE